MLMTTTGFGQDVVSASVRMLFNRALEEQASQLYYSQLGLNDTMPDVPAEQISGVTGPGRGFLTIEGQQYGSNEKVREYPVTWGPRKFTSELSWTEEDVHWLAKANESSKRVIDFTNMGSQAVQALNQNINEEACKTFYLGFGTTFLTVGNSEALFGSHTLRVGGTQRNTFPSGSTHKALNSDSLIEALQIMARFKAQNGNQLLKPTRLKLVVPVELEATAKQIVYSAYGPQNANLGLNKASDEMLAKQGFSIEVVVGRDIPAAYSTYWFLVDEDRAKTRAFMGWAWKPRMNDFTRYDKGIYLNESSTILAPYSQGWQWAFGSKGDGTSI